MFQMERKEEATAGVGDGADFIGGLSLKIKKEELEDGQSESGY